MSPFVKDNKIPASPAGRRSETIAVIETPEGSKEVIEKLKKNGLIVGTGYKDFKKKQIRIANFPSHKISDTKLLLREIEDF